MSADYIPMAFPVNAANLGGPGAYVPAPGMTLRDWFAGQAIGLTGTWAMDFTKDASPAPMAAAMAYEIADAMLAERKKGGDA